MNTFPKTPVTKSSIANRRLRFGCCVNDSDYKTSFKDGAEWIVCPIYTRWSKMINRVYSSNVHKDNPRYIGVSLCSEWHKFSNFEKWMVNQDWEGMELDKDILSPPGNTIYSPETCSFVPKEINDVVNSDKSNKGKYPVGVSFDKFCGLFKAAMSRNKVSVNLGRFKCPDKAHLAYLKAKREYVSELVSKYSEVISDDVRMALLSRY